MSKEWQIVYTTGMMHLAEIAKGVLEEQNIRSVLIDKRDSSYISLMGEIQLFVRLEDYILAKIIIEEAKL